MECKICKKQLTKFKQLRRHLDYCHKISIYDYDQEYGDVNLEDEKRCRTCNKLLIPETKYEFCSKHRPRSGKDNPFFGKTHSKEVIENLRESSRIHTKKM